MLCRSRLDDTGWSRAEVVDTGKNELAGDERLMGEWCG